MNGEAFEAQGRQNIVDDQRDFDIGGVGIGADGVAVALVKLAVAAVLGVLAAPDRADVVALKGCAELADVLGGEAGEGHGQIETQGHVETSVKNIRCIIL